jgi:hypothetical protein
MEIKGKGKKGFSGNPAEAAPGFPEKEYQESLKGDPPKSEYAKGGSQNSGLNPPGSKK